MSACFLAVLLVEVAYRLSPSMTLWFSGIIATTLVLQYFVLAMDWIFWLVVKVYEVGAAALEALGGYTLAPFHRVRTVLDRLALNLGLQM